jgi:hypothetical protein
MDKTLSLSYTVKPISFEKINNEFTLCRCYVMALGKNRNYSHFSKESVEKALPSLFNIPVVAHIKKADDGHWYVGSHDRQIVIDDSGITVNDLTLPYGVVPESCDPEFIEVTEKDGSKATYLVCSLILWTGRYPEILEAKSQTDEDVYFNESMEISILGWQVLKDDKNYSDITDFIFSALCLLGRDSENPEYHTEPCFPSSRVEPFQYNLSEDKFKEEFALMQNELKKISLNFDNKSFSNNREEGNKLLDEKIIELLGKYNLTAETVDFEIDNLSYEDIESKLKEKYNQTDDEPKNDFSATYMQKRDALRNALDAVYVKDADGNIIESTYFYLMDFTDDYVYVEKDYWNEAGDFEETYGRFSYEFNDETVEATITSEFEEMFIMWLTKEEKDALEAERNDYASIKSEFDAYKETYKTPETEVEQLRTFQNDRLAEDRKNAEEQIFTKFDELLGDNETYKALKENAKDYSVDELVKECNALYGELQTNFSLDSKVKKADFTKVRVDTTVEGDDSTYGGLFARFGKKKNDK